MYFFFVMSGIQFTKLNSLLFFSDKDKRTDTVTVLPSSSEIKERI